LLSGADYLYQKLNACHASAEGREGEVWGWHHEKNVAEMKFKLWKEVRDVRKRQKS
jgi:hypothetical protein